MVTRYVSQPKADWLDDMETALKPSLTVYEPNGEPRKTGLLDKNGNPIVCIEDRPPIGFIWHNRS